MMRGFYGYILSFMAWLAFCGAGLFAFARVVLCALIVLFAVTANSADPPVRSSSFRVPDASVSTTQRVTLEPAGVTLKNASNVSKGTWSSVSGDFSTAGSMTVTGALSAASGAFSGNVTGTWNGSTISTAKGGTGLTGFTTGDLFYASDSSTISKLPIGTNGQILKISGSSIAWGTEAAATSGHAQNTDTGTDSAYFTFGSLEDTYASGVGLIFGGAYSGSGEDPRIDYSPEQGGNNRFEVSRDLYTAGQFIGSAAGVTNVPAASLTGTINNARLSNAVPFLGLSTNKWSAAQTLPGVTLQGALTATTGSLTAAYMTVQRSGYDGSLKIYDASGAFHSITANEEGQFLEFSGNTNTIGTATFAGNVTLGDSAADSVVTYGPSFVINAGNGSSAAGILVKDSANDGHEFKWNQADGWWDLRAAGDSYEDLWLHNLDSTGGIRTDGDLTVRENTTLGNESSDQIYFGCSTLEWILAPQKLTYGRLLVQSTSDYGIGYSTSLAQSFLPNTVAYKNVSNAWLSNQTLRALEVQGDLTATTGTISFGGTIALGDASTDDLTIADDDPTFTNIASATPATLAVFTSGNVLGTIASVPISLGGTGQTGATAAFDALAPTTTRGDLIYRGASNNLRLAKGTTGHVLAQGANDPYWADPNSLVSTPNLASVVNAGGAWYGADNGYVNFAGYQDLYIEADDGDSSNGFNVFISSGAGKAPGFTAGGVLLTGGIGGDNDSGVAGTGGGIVITGGGGGSATDPSATAGDGGPVNIIGGACGAADGATPGNGGDVILTGGVASDGSQGGSIILNPAAGDGSWGTVEIATAASNQSPVNIGYSGNPITIYGTLAGDVSRNLTYVSANVQSQTNTSENDLMTYSLGGGTLSATGDSIEIIASGTFVTGTAATKQVKLKFGSTTLIDTGALAFNTGNWEIVARVYRTGATTQEATATFTSSLAVLNATTLISSPAETLSGAVTVKCTGQVAATGAAGDITQTGMQVRLWK